MAIDAVTNAALESLLKDILPRLKARQKVVGTNPKAMAADKELQALTAEAAELRAIVKQGGGTLPADTTDAEVSDDDAQMLLAEMDAPITEDDEVSDLPAALAPSELSVSDDEIMTVMLEADDPEVAAALTADAGGEMSDDEAAMLLGEMDAPLATPSVSKKAAAAPAKDMSDDEAAMLLAAMDGPASVPSPAKGKSAAPAAAMSDDEAAALLAAMDGAPPAPPKAVAAKPSAPVKPVKKALSADDEAAALLAALGGAEDEEEEAAVAIPAHAPAQAPAAKAATADANQHGDWEEMNEWTANDFQTDPDMVNDFIVNSDELMTTLDEAVLSLEQNPENKEIIEGIFRGAHTLKGAAGMFGFSAMERVMHRMESLFDLVRKGKLRATSDIIDLLFRGMDTIRPLLQAVKDGKPCGVKTGPVVKSLTLAAQGIFDKPAAGGASGSAKSAESASSESRDSAPTAHAAPAAEGGDNAKKKEEQTTIRVDLSRLDTLVNLIGELVIDRTRFVTIEEELRTNHPQVKLSGNIAETVQLFGRHMNEIQDIIMKVRMVPIGNAFNKFSRIVRDLSKQLGKKIELVISGESAELDKTLVEQIGDPLIHLIRNSCDHGIELPDARKAKGKNPTGRIHLSARQEGNHIVITIEDDGKGIPVDIIRKKGIEKGLINEDQQLTERDILNLIFEPGFSTAEKVTNVSGRGVGMDVVKKQVNKLKGAIDIGSAPDKGTTMTIRLPLTLAIVQSLLVGSRGEVFAIPLSSVIESIRIVPDDIQKIGEREVIKLRDQVLPLMHLDDALSLQTKAGNMAELVRARGVNERPRATRQRAANRLFVVVVGQADRPFGLVVDQLLHQQEMVIKSMGNMMRDIPCVAGGAVLGNGKVVLVLDVPELENSFRAKARTQAAA